MFVRRKRRRAGDDDDAHRKDDTYNDAQYSPFILHDVEQAAVIQEEEKYPIHEDCKDREERGEDENVDDDDSNTQTQPRSPAFSASSSSIFSSSEHEIQLQQQQTSHDIATTQANIANHAKLFRKIPFANRNMFIKTMQTMLMQYAKASINSQQSEQHNIIADILSIPGKTMISRRGGKQGRNRDIIIMQHRLAEQQNNHIAAASSTQRTTSFIQSNQRVTRSMSQAPVLASINRSVALTREGHIRRAVRALNSTPLIDSSDPSKLAMLRNLHPVADDSSLPSLPPGTPATFVHADGELVKVISKLANGSAPGPSGWTAEMVQVLCKDQEC